MRCLQLAKAMSYLGWQCVFVCRSWPGDVTERIISAGFTYHTLPPLEQTQENDDYASWLGAEWQEDALLFSQYAEDADWVIVDHYGISAHWELEVKKRTSARIMAIDDIKRSHECHLLLDSSPLASKEDYPHLPNDCLTCFGTQYALINPAFSAKAPLAVVPKQHTVLVFMGGSDPRGITFKILKVLSQTETGFHFNVILNPQNDSYADVSALCYENSAFTLFDFVEDMPRFLHTHTLAIGTPGGASLERLCAGIPSVLIAIADNQIDNFNALKDSSAVAPVTLNRLNTDLVPALTGLTHDYLSRQKAARDLCDGKGIARVIDHLKQHAPSTPVTLRAANHKDIKQVYEWQCLPETRRYALTQDTPSWPSHHAWMTKKLVQTEDYFYIVMLSQEAQKNTVGVVRLDKQPQGHYLVSIFIDPTFFGQGIALKALVQLRQLHPDAIIHAQVLKENIASQKLFEKAGYQRISDEYFTQTPLGAPDDTRN